MNELRQEMMQLLSGTESSRPAALRRSLREDFLYATDLPQVTGDSDVAAFRRKAEECGWRTAEEDGWILLDRIPDTSFTVSSSSVRNLRGIFRKNIVCGYDFPNTFRACDRYYFAVKLLSELEETDLRPVHTFGVDVTLLEALAEYSRSPLSMRPR